MISVNIFLLESKVSIINLKYLKQIGLNRLANGHYNFMCSLFGINKAPFKGALLLK